MRVVIGLVVVICLALLAQMTGISEGYSNRNTRYSESNNSPEINLILRKIYYFNGKKIDGTPPLTYLKPIGNESAKELEDIIKNWMVTGKYNNAIKTQTEIIDTVRTRLLVVVDEKNVPDFFSSHESSVKPYKAAAVFDPVNDIPVNITQVIQYFRKLDFITKEQAGELNALAIKGQLDINNTIIERLKKIVGADKYVEFIIVYNQIEHAKVKTLITDTYATQMYGMLYREKSTANVTAALERDIAKYNTDLANISTEISNTPSYNANVSNVKYHDDPTTFSDPQRDIMIRGPDGKMIKWTDAVKTTARYNESGYARYSPSNYVPDYEDSVFLSRFSSYAVDKPVVDYAFGVAPDKSGFCKANENNLSEMESKCMALDAGTCASTSCCALLGGTKCVAGNESGPTNRANYSDISVVDRDFYYFQGKCYGNCP